MSFIFLDWDWVFYSPREVLWVLPQNIWNQSRSADSNPISKSDASLTRVSGRAANSIGNEYSWDMVVNIKRKKKPKVKNTLHPHGESDSDKG